MTDVDLIKILGYGGWRIDSQEVVTAANQVANATGMLAGCTLAAKAKLYQAGDPAMYLPPVGWTVIVATKDSDDGGEDVEYVWVDPSGTAWLPSKCSNASVGSAGVLPQIVPASAGGSGLVFLLLGGALLWLLLKGK